MADSTPVRYEMEYYDQGAIDQLANTKVDVSRVIADRPPGTMYEISLDRNLIVLYGEMIDIWIVSDIINEEVDLNVPTMSFAVTASHIILDCSFSNDSKMLVICGSDKLVNVWNMSKMKHIVTFTGHTKSVTHCIFTDDNKFVISYGNDDSVMFWNLDTKTCTRIIENQAAFSKNIISPYTSGSIVTTGKDDIMRFWDIDTGKVSKTLEHATGYPYRYIIPLSDKLGVFVKATRLYLWDIERQLNLGKLAGSTVNRSMLNQNMIMSVYQGISMLRDISSGKIIRRFNMSDLTTASRFSKFSMSIVNDCDFSFDSKIYAACSKGIVLWDIESSDNIDHIDPHVKIVRCSFLHSSRMLVSMDANGTFKLWDLEARL